MSPIRTVNDYLEITYDAVELYNNHEYEKALAKFLEMRESNFKNTKIHEMLVYVYLQLGKLEEAEKEYQILQEILKEEGTFFRKPRTFEEVVQDAGDIKNVEKEYAKMMKHFKELNLIQDSVIPMKLSFLYMAQGEFQKAEEVLIEFKEKYLAAAL